MTIGEKISARRKELGLTLEDIGNAVGVGKSTVKKWESGYIANMRRDKIAALSKILQMGPTEFISTDTEEWDKKYNPVGKLTAEVALHESIIKLFGEQAAELVDIFNNLNEEGQERLYNTALDMSLLEHYKKGDSSEVAKKEA